MFKVVLEFRVAEFLANQAFSVKHSICGVIGSGRFGRVADETFAGIEGYVGRCGTVTLVIGDDFDVVILPDSDAGIGGSQIDSDGAFDGGSCGGGGCHTGLFGWYLYGGVFKWFWKF
jgi:hypothetical protein